jgi:alcohol dehydrogenase class IV
MTTTFNAAATKTVGVNATNFEFTFTRLERIAFGPGKITTLGAELERMGATRALVATGKTLGASPLLERVTAAMGPHCAGVFAGVGQHVPASSARALVAEAERVGADALVAFGGGSPIDACKVAAASLLNRRDMTLVAGEIDFDGASRAGGAGREIPLVAVPTTLSAGEFTPGGGVTDEATRVKRIVADARLQHRTVIYDPELCLNTPDWLWVATGMRALDHAIEGIYSTRAQPFTDTLGAEAIRLMMAHLPGSVGGGSDRLAERGSPEGC